VVKRGFGTLGWSNNSAPVSVERTIYDLASLTKVVATTTAAMVLFDEGKLALDAPVRQYVPAFAGGGKDRVTVRHLLTHRSGLPAGRDLWRSASNSSEARRQVLETPIYCSPGACFEYSDLGADVLGFVVEAVSGQRLDRFVEERVFAPLGMSETGFRPDAALRERIAPTELTPPRGYPIRGEVHDENAYALGGIAGHAGLFSTAADLSVFAQMMLNGGVYNGVRVVSDSAVRLFTRRAAGTRALGWDTCDRQGGCGAVLGPRAYGHTGFTGTSLWIDPDRDMFVVLLTNRVHAARAGRPAKVISDVRADLADAAALAVLDADEGVAAMPLSFRADEASGWNRIASRASARSAKAKKSARGKRASAKGSKSASASKRGAKASKTAGKATTGKSAKGKTGVRRTASGGEVAKSLSTKASAKSRTAKAATTKAATAKRAPAKKPAAKGGKKR
jgi:CubicO group peptidase (beta-lactamase class C family)